MRHLLSTQDLSRAQATAILDEAERFEQALTGREVKKLPTLRGRTVMTVFYENSTRTRVSFEVAGKWMSADVINVSASSSSAGKGESLRDTVKTLHAAGADALKLFPAELVAPSVLRAMASVFPRGTRFLPVGGITPDGMAPYLAAGAAGFGLGSALYKPGMSAAEVGTTAKAFADAWRSRDQGGRQ